MSNNLDKNRREQRRADEETYKELLILYHQSSDRVSQLQYEMLLRHYACVLKGYSSGK